MSRALDRHVIAALKAADGGAAYKDIANALTSPASTGLLDIEFLGQSHPTEAGTHLLRDGDCIAIPKFSLVQAFFVARKVFQKYQQTRNGQGESLLEATAVMLLMDPEHLTAANSRKRLLEGGHEYSDHLEALTREKHFVDSLLTSRLHRHTKSPTLWGHRQWLLRLMSSLGVSLDVYDDLTKVVMVSAERHPRNYYAWCHARWLTTLAQEGPEGGTLRTSLLEVTKAWCYRHHTDISGWSFFQALLLGSPDEPLAKAKACSSVLVEIARLAASLRWDNESVWVFLRTVASSRFMDDEGREQFIKSNHALRERHPQTSAQWVILHTSEVWYDLYRWRP
jgi:protein prenyltransferase alpha subunit repeat containing protein 1